MDKFAGVGQKSNSPRSSTRSKESLGSSTIMPEELHTTSGAGGVLVDFLVVFVVAGAFVGSPALVGHFICTYPTLPSIVV